MVGFSIPVFASEVIKPNYVEGEILVKYKNNDINLKTEAGELKAMSVATFNSLDLKENITESNISLLKITDDKTVEQKITEVQNDPNVLYAEPNYLRYPSTINTDDTYKDLLWGLDNTGQNANGELGTTDADMDAPEAWAINEGTNASVIVAVLDTGIAYNHPDLQANMWDGTNCKSDTGAFLGSCIHGYDYLDNDKDPLPAGAYYLSHGTHVAGIIAAVKNNGKGIIGVAPNAKLMALRFNYTISSEVKAINFARQNGAKIINASFGGGTYSQSEFDAINLFKQSGGIFLAAASNDSTNNDIYYMYPANYSLDNIISVAATDQNDKLATFSNYGLTTVDVGAPGVNIYSTLYTISPNIFDTRFSGGITDNIPTGWIRGGSINNWGFGSYYSPYYYSGSVLYGDTNRPYLPNTNSTITSPLYKLGINDASMSFWAGCNTEYDINNWTDYMALEFSNDDFNTFSQILKFDEAQLDKLNASTTLNSIDGAVHYFKDINIPSEYLNSDFKFRFRWVTNENTDSGNGNGCWFNSVDINQLDEGSKEAYGYNGGTSMSTPQVAGLAALIWGTKPSLTYAQVKNVILTTGDSIPSLNNKTVSGKRINAYNAIASLSGPISNIIYSLPNKLVKAGDLLTITANFNEPILDTPVMKIAINGSNTLAPTDMTKVSNTQYTYVYTVGAGDGIATISLSNGTNVEGGLVVSTPVSGSTFTIDNTAPTVSLSSPSSLLTKSGPITYTATYTDANNITLSNTDVILNTTGTATGTITVSGLDNISREISISNITGDGTLGISIASNTATDIAGNNSLAFGPSEIFTIDNTAPSKPTISSVAIDNAISYEERNAIHIIGTAEVNSLVTATLSDGTNIKVGTQQLINDGTNFDITIDGTTAAPTALLNGTIIVSVTASDIAGNISPVSTLNVIQSAQMIVVSSGGGGGGGGGYTQPAVTVTTPETIITEVTVDLGCKAGSLFSTTTGKKCSTITTIETVVPGCNGTSLFSTISGKSCGVLNTTQPLNPITNTPTALNITHTLKQGSNNADVKELQKYLNNNGYNCGNPDGSFGPMTKKAVIAFQIANKLKGDGIVGKMTVKTMDNILNY
jgi:subtilisin family serine protease